ncbi:MAG: FAD-binding oxidoreductase [Lapillicoccus sp.]
MTRARVGWHVATVVETRPETATATRITLDVPTWPGNRAGAHLDVRLTAPDGYQATRSYSIATSGETTRVVLAVDELPEGEVSPFLVHELRAGDTLELHGPLGSYFLWPPAGSDTSARTPVQLIAGGSGVVPLYAMAARRGEGGGGEVGGGEFRLLYSVRGPDDAFFGPELTALAASGALRLDWVHTRRVPEGSPTSAGRLTRDRLRDLAVAPDAGALVYCCGPTPFVEAVAGWLLEIGFPAEHLLTERFGGG